MKLSRFDPGLVPSQFPIETVLAKLVNFLLPVDGVVAISSLIDIAIFVGQLIEFTHFTITKQGTAFNFALSSQSTLRLHDVSNIHLLYDALFDSLAGYLFNGHHHKLVCWLEGISSLGSTSENISDP